MHAAEMYRPGSESGAVQEDRHVDVIGLGIVAAAILLFVATGSSIGPSIVRSLIGRGPGPDSFLLNAFLLNIAIIIFGMSRYRQLCQEIAERKRAEHTARRMADTDPLTGFFNRRSFNVCLEAMLTRASQPESAVGLMMIDLDNFKQVNDHNGHAAGDLLLVECARRIQAALPEAALVGRIGGDEFAIAVPFDRDRVERLDRIAALLIDAIAESARIDTISVDVTASVGVARSDLTDPAVASSAGELLEMADIAMYHSKRRGRNAYCWFAPHMAEEKRFRAELERGIREGVARGEFVPFYERQVDLRTGELSGFEMLARWDSPQFGIVAPDVFIPVAEEIGVIAELSESIIAQALLDAQEWDQRLSLAVNISPVQLQDPWFAQKLLRMLVEANFPPQRLEVEITESSLHENLPQVSALITSLKNQGIRISLDDFGTGYSSIGQLRTLPFDRIKIDRSFISSLIDDKDSAAIVRAVATLGEGLELPVTAEGIETQDVLDHLRQYGDITGQGYLYGRPRPARELAEWLDPATTPGETPEPPQARHG